MRGLCAALFDLALSGIASAINTRANWRAFRPRFYVTSGLWRKCVFPTPMGSDQILSFLGKKRRHMPGIYPEGDVAASI